MEYDIDKDQSSDQGSNVCKYCKSPIPARPKICPVCHRYQKWWIINHLHNVGLIIALMLVFLGYLQFNEAKKDRVAASEALNQVQLSEKRINKLFQYSLRIKDLSSKIVINIKTKSKLPEKFHTIMGASIYLGLLQGDDRNNEHYLTSKGVGAITEYIDGKGNSKIQGDVVVTPDNHLSNKRISFLENFNDFAVWISLYEKGSMQNIESISVSIIFFINQIEMGKIEADNLKFETIGEGDKSYKALVIRDHPVFVNAEEKFLKIIESD